MAFVTHLESALDGTRYPAGEIQTTHQGRPLWVRYDLDAIRNSIDREELKDRSPTMWRYRELLPVEETVVSLDEQMTPLLRCERLGDALGSKNLLVKDESRLPTGSFKARGMAMAVSMAKKFGIERVAVPSAGNAGGALAAYAARAGMECDVFVPADTPAVNRGEAAVFGATVHLVDGLIHDCAARVQDKTDWFDMSTLKEPYRLEGKKTMGLELAEQLGWELPDVILYPTGGGTGLIGMWKAFEELGALRWLENDARPRMYACQSEGCAPISAAFEKGERFATPPENPHTVASGLRCPKAVGDFMILDAVRASKGRAVAVPEGSLLHWMHRAAELEGISLCPETGACLAALEKEIADGRIGADERVVVFNTAAVQKYVELLTKSP